VPNFIKQKTFLNLNLLILTLQFIISKQQIQTIFFVTFTFWLPLFHLIKNQWHDIIEHLNKLEIPEG